MSQMKAVQDVLLSTVSQEVQVKGCIADKVFPVIKSAQDTGLLAKYGKEHLRIVNSVTGGRGRYRQIDTRTYSTQQFQIEGHGLEGLVTKQDYRNKQKPFDAEKDEVKGIETMLTLEKEKTLADALTSTTIVTNNTTLVGNAQLSDYTNSDPISVFSAARASFINKAGNTPNKVILDLMVWEKLRFHAKLLSNLGYTNVRPGGISRAEFASILEIELENLLITEARYNAGKQGLADDMQSVWGKNIVFLHAPKEAVVYQQSAGYLVTPEGSSPRKVYKQSNFNPPGSTTILCEDEYDQLVSDVDCIYLVKNAIA